MFEPDVLRAHGIDHGLVFVRTDHGFALGHDPSVTSAERGVVVARWRGDGLDALLWNRLGRPNTYCYDYSPGVASSFASVRPCVPEANARRIEAESLWPPLAVRGGWMHPDYSGDSCVSHPFMSLFETFRHMPEPEFHPRLRDVYLEPWGGSELLDTFELALRVGTIAHSFAWLRQYDNLRTDEERRAFGIERMLRLAVAATD